MLAAKLLPPLLFLLKPPRELEAASPDAQRCAATTGAGPPGGLPATASDALLLPPPGSPLSNMIRGSLALLLRTCSATDPRDSYLALAVAADEAERVRARGVAQNPPDVFVGRKTETQDFNKEVEQDHGKEARISFRKVPRKHAREVCEREVVRGWKLQGRVHTPLLPPRPTGRSEIGHLNCHDLL